MATDPRSALTTLVTALERHLEACSSRTGEEDPRVIAAYNDLADAFEDYDDALLEAHGEVTPFEVYSDDDEDDLEDDDFDDDEEDGPLAGRYDDEYDGDQDSYDYDDDSEVEDDDVRG
ncbi:hypothetical protein [Kytococcus schroeteri]|uniref:hypothetical protein n=1 Tax=Kytococcus schroeteri TaxID=138300 RepID=UPI0011434FFA|nr:hypothetical protein [Kytococcus schroeteri]